MGFTKLIGKLTSKFKNLPSKEKEKNYKKLAKKKSRDLLTMAKNNKLSIDDFFWTLNQKIWDMCSTVQDQRDLSKNNKIYESFQKKYSDYYSNTTTTDEQKTINDLYVLFENIKKSKSKSRSRSKNDILKLSKKKSRDLLTMTQKGTLLAKDFLAALDQKIIDSISKYQTINNLDSEYDSFKKCDYDIDTIYKNYISLKNTIKKRIPNKEKAPMAKKLIESMFEGSNDKIKKEFMDAPSYIQDDAKFKKYAKMDIDTLKQFFDSNKITEADFCLLVTQKMNNMFGTDDKKNIIKILDAAGESTNLYSVLFKQQLNDKDTVPN